jgi:type II secretory pathway component PulK
VKVPNLYNLYARSAERADDQQLERLISSLQAEPNKTAHIAQALAAYSDEAARRKAEKEAADSGRPPS